MPLTLGFENDGIRSEGCLAARIFSGNGLASGSDFAPFWVGRDVVGGCRPRTFLGGGGSSMSSTTFSFDHECFVNFVDDERFGGRVADTSRRGTRDGADAREVTCRRVFALSDRERGCES